MDHLLERTLQKPRSRKTNRTLRKLKRRRAELVSQKKVLRDPAKMQEQSLEARQASIAALECLRSAEAEQLRRSLFKKLGRKPGYKKTETAKIDYTLDLLPQIKAKPYISDESDSEILL